MARSNERLGGQRDGKDAETSGDRHPQGDGGEVLAVVVGDTVTVRYVPADDGTGTGSHVVLEWEGGRQGDMVADGVIAVVLQAVGEPAGAATAESAMLRARADGDEASAAAAELHLMAALLRGQFGPAAVDEAAGSISLSVDGVAVSVDHRGGKVACGEPGLRARVEKSLDRLAAAIRPVAVDRPHE
ncbi:Cleavage and polyadenylation specificity factor subunit 3-I [Tetrabaena socialis]|uniref:Cleavage and polyadenylation specificity factor subunit 3-I n=1 Tax=Tetrabaena socialis TaxID=47790 RepID=A0A2J8AAT2_9CHLO|nr:Cleavage and polyadenylation specificity factor subunit 3-I [Tetrabaena socialis]|eukprot:PNH09617.1 Cleavage and polyadenylation specificity factor subunit 3-I [Tetrabaena socialis]